jgi:hypothetical protein
MTVAPEEKAMIIESNDVVAGTTSRYRRTSKPVCGRNSDSPNAAACALFRETKRKIDTGEELFRRTAGSNKPTILKEKEELRFMRPMV